MALYTSNDHPHHYDIVDNDTDKVVGRMVPPANESMVIWRWEIDGCGSCAESADQALADAQARYDLMQDNEREDRADKARLEAVDDVLGMASLLKNVSIELECELKRNHPRPADIDLRKQQLREIRNRIAVHPLRYRGFTIQPDGEDWLTINPVDKKARYWSDLATALREVDFDLDGHALMLEAYALIPDAKP